MADISYTPNFRNVDYVDGEDRVKAEGDNGFNARFATIESDLARFSTVVATIDATLDQLESPPPTTRRLVVPLRLVATGSDPAWRSVLLGAQVSPGQGANGVINPVMPDGVLLVSLRAVGRALAVSVAISLTRTPIGGGNPQELASLTGNTDPFDITKPVDAATARVDTGAFAYRVRATVGAGAANLVTGVITGIQLTVTG